MKSKSHFNKPFKLYHLSSENLDGKLLEPRPMDPERVMEGEDWKLPRICVSNSIGGSVSALVDCVANPFGMKFWVHVPVGLEALFKANQVYRPSTKQVPDAETTGEHWLKAPVKLKAIGQVEVVDIDHGYEATYMHLNEVCTMHRYKLKWLKKLEDLV